MKKILIGFILLATATIGGYLIINNKNGTDEKVESITDNVDTGTDVDFSKYEEEDLVLDDETVTITEGGVYNVTGTISNGSIIIDTTEDVKLILNNVSFTNESGPAIYVKQADNVYIETLEGTTSYITDGEDYSDTSLEAAIYSSDDLVFTGSGTLVVTGNYMDAIACTDDLLFISGTYDITAVDDGIRGKDSVIIEDGNFKITAGADGIKTTNEEDSTEGYIIIKNGTFDIDAVTDGIQAITELNILNGTFDIKTTGLTSTSSAKGLKAGTSLIVTDGTFNIVTTDDAIHSYDVWIKGGTFTLSASDDGIHADNSVIIDGGTITISKSYEGIEGSNITVNGGTITLTSSDDGFNVNGGADSSAYSGTGATDSTTSGTHVLTITGGTIYVNATGDGLDSNGSIVMSGGTVVVNGPTNDGNGSLDYDETFTITGGILVASGSSGMAQMPSTSSSQNSIMIGFTSSISTSTIITIKDSSGNEILTYKASKAYVNLVVSSPSLSNGTYSIYTGVTNSNSSVNGIYESGSTGGSLFKEFTISSTSTTIGTISGTTTGGSMNRR